jgi:hypothetical protein
MPAVGRFFGVWRRLILYKAGQKEGSFERRDKYIFSS